MGSKKDFKKMVVVIDGWNHSFYVKSDEVMN